MESRSGSNRILWGQLLQALATSFFLSARPQQPTGLLLLQSAIAGARATPKSRCLGASRYKVSAKISDMAAVQGRSA